MSKAFGWYSLSQARNGTYVYKSSDGKSEIIVTEATSRANYIPSTPDATSRGSLGRFVRAVPPVTDNVSAAAAASASAADASPAAASAATVAASPAMPASPATVPVSLETSNATLDDIGEPGDEDLDALIASLGD